MKSLFLKYLIILAITSLLSLLLLVMFRHPLYGIDDANIFFVYAKNLAAGHGFVYNIGGERVEGFTSLLWTLVCAIAFAISSFPELILLIATIAFLSFGITLACMFLPSFFNTKADAPHPILWQAAFIVLLFITPAYVAWNTVTLMENALWSTLLLVTSLVVVTARNRTAVKTNMVCAVLFIMLLCTRPESFLWVPVFIAVLYMVRLPDLGYNRAVRSILFLLLCYAVTVLALTLFRLSYFGYPLPNTFYAKVSPSVSYNLYLGLRYLFFYFLSSPLIWLCFCALGFNLLDILFHLFSNKKKTIEGPAYLSVIAVVGLGIPVLVGGDHFGSFRFYQYVYPILILNLLYCIRCILPKYLTFSFSFPSDVIKKAGIGIVVMACATVPVYSWYRFPSSSEMAHEFLIAELGRERGRFMHALFSGLPALPRIGAVVAGAQKLTYPGEVVDLMGLNNNLMAKNRGKRRGEKNHAAFEKTTFFQLTPDIVTPEVVTEDTWLFIPDSLSSSFANRALKGLYDDPRFHARYVFGKLKSASGGQEKALVGWIHKDFLNRLEREESIHVTTYTYRKDVL